MKPSFIAAAAILLFSVDTSGQSQNLGMEYTSPLPGSAMVSRFTNIILRPSRAIPPQGTIDRASIRVTGSRSGEAAGNLIHSDDGKTLIFEPARPFAPEETVTVAVRPHNGGTGERAGRSPGFSFSTSGYSAEARTVSDDPAPAMQGRDLLRSVRSAEPGLPADFPAVTVTRSDNPSPGCLFLSNMTMGSGATNSPYIMILDNTGVPVFYRSTRDECTDFKVQPNGLITYMDSYLHCFLALDSSYAVVDTFRCGNGYSTNWHELRILPDGHALILGDDPQVIRMDSIVPGGYPSAVVQGIVIQELDRSKHVVFQWRTFDHFKITDATHEDLTASFIDCVHSNAIEPDTDGTLMLSSRHMDEITKISRLTGDIIWRWGGKNNQFTFVNDSLGFRHQHAIRRLPNGNVTLFDNGDFRFPLLSRAVEYRLDEETRQAVLVWQYREKPDIYASAMGYVQRLSGGNTLVGWGAANTTLTEIRPDGGIAMELTFPPGVYSYRSYRFPWKPAVTGAPRTPPVPGAFSLAQNYPNPFNPATTIGYRIPEAGRVTLRVYDTLGRNVATVVDRMQVAGDHSVRFDGSTLGTGVYFYTLESGARAATGRMLLLK